MLTSIAGTFFVKLGSKNSIMGALYKGFIATALLSIVAVALAIWWLVGFSTEYTVGVKTFTGLEPVPLRHRRPRRHRPDHLDHRILHRHELPPGAVDRHRPP